MASKLPIGFSKIPIHPAKTCGCIKSKGRGYEGTKPIPPHGPSPRKNRYHPMSANDLTLGLILLKEGKLNKDQLKKVLLKQGELRRFGRYQRFGEVLAKLEFLPEEEIQAALEMQELLLVPTTGHTALGLMLIATGLLSPSQVVSALQEQQGNEKRLGEILIAQGVLTESQLEPLLAKQLEDRDAAQAALKLEMRSSGLLTDEDEEAFVVFDMG